MTHLLSRAAAAAALSLLLAGSAFAQTPSTTPATTPSATPAAKSEKTEKPRTAASLDCSKQADAKGLHGKERRTFRSECKKTSKMN